MKDFEQKAILGICIFVVVGTTTAQIFKDNSINKEETKFDKDVKVAIEKIRKEKKNKEETNFNKLEINTKELTTQQKAIWDICFKRSKVLSDLVLSGSKNKKAIYKAYESRVKACEIAKKS